MQTHTNRRLAIVLNVLLVMILTLMALGAGVRTMNAGLSCPDWPLCFGKVIPDFHPGVYFEFIHRAYAGLVGLVFFGCCLRIVFSKGLPASARIASVFGLVVLVAQVVMGALTVLKTIGPLYVTSHLMLATLFFCSVLWMRFAIRPQVERAPAQPPWWIYSHSLITSAAVLFQILLGGLVASTYAGMVCVDWPLCNGQWIPTLKGPIGLQIIHRFFAYGLAVGIPLFAFVAHRNRRASWMTKQLLGLSLASAGIVLLQVVIGISNLLLFIPPWLTVIHQSVALILLAVSLRMYFVARQMAPVIVPAAESPRAYAVAGVSG